MEIRIRKKDVAWGYIAQIVNAGAGILLLPFIGSLLPPDVFGMWQIFLTLGFLAMMLDLGFLPTFARNVSYLFGGATRLLPEGTDENATVLEHPNYPLLHDLIRTMRRFYLLAALGAGLLLLTAGTWYVHLKTGEFSAASKMAEPHVLLAWVVYAVSVLVNLYFSYYNALIFGRGLIRENNQLIIVTRLSFLVLAIAALYLGYGLMGVAVSNLLSMVINRTLARRFFHKGGLKNQLRIHGKTGENLFPVVWFNARKLALINLGNYMTGRVNVLLISIFLTLETTGSYGLTLNVIGILVVASPLYLNSHLPEVYKNRIRCNRRELRRIMGESILVFNGLYLAGAMVVLLLANPALQAVGVQTPLIPFPALLLLLIHQFFDLNQNMAVTFLTSMNRVPHLKAYLISGIGATAVSALLLAFTDLNIFAVIVAPALIQICYNYWKWPAEVKRELAMPYRRLRHIGHRELKAWFFRHYTGPGARK